LYDSRHSLRVAVALAVASARILCVPSRGTVRSAKRTVIQTCKQCGAINQSSVESCCFCSARLNPPAETDATSVPDGLTVPKFSLGASAKTSGSLALQPEWRREVTHRLRSYREKRRQPGVESQTALEFEHEVAEHPAQVEAAREVQSSEEHMSENEFEHPVQVQPQIHYESQFDHEFDEATDASVALDEDQYEDPLQATLAAAAARVEMESAPPATVAKQSEAFQHLLIDVSRPPEVEGPIQQAAAESLQSAPRLDSTLLPVAELSVRRRAAAVDAVCLLLAYAAILGAFTIFGGKLLAGKLDVFVCGAILVLLYAQYFALFTMMGGSTPGMMLAGLRLVSFDGSAPEPRQLIRRSAGYLLSGGVAWLGFLWAFWDEDHLSWHDHISQTYITTIEAVSEAGSEMGESSQ
jgi:uncharacterized RDD family membrane protein YckC